MKQTFVLGVHPSARGFGWALFDNPLAPFDWGTVHIRRAKNYGALARFQKLVHKYEPEAVVFEDYARDGARRAQRIRMLYRGFTKIAEAQGASVAVYSREEIAQALGADSTTRDEIAARVADRVAALRSQQPHPRKSWQGEHPNTALFAAAACALTYLLGQRS